MYLMNQNNSLVNYWQRYDAGLKISAETEENTQPSLPLPTQSSQIPDMDLQTDSDCPGIPFWEDFCYRSGGSVNMSDGTAVLMLLLLVLILVGIIGCAYLCSNLLDKIKSVSLLNEDDNLPSYDEVAENDNTQLPSYSEAARELQNNNCNKKNDIDSIVDKNDNKELPSYSEAARELQNNNCNKKNNSNDDNNDYKELPSYSEAERELQNNNCNKTNDSIDDKKDNKQLPYTNNNCNIEENVENNKKQLPSYEKSRLRSYWKAANRRNNDKNCKTNDNKKQLPSYWKTVKGIQSNTDEKKQFKAVQIKIL